MSKIINILEEARNSKPLYLLLAFIINIVFVFFLAFISLKLESEFYFILISISVLNGLLAWFFMNNKNQFSLFLYSIFFSYLMYFIYEYIFFMHFYNFETSLYWDKSVVDISLITKYFSVLGKFTLKFFLSITEMYSI